MDAGCANSTSLEPSRKPPTQKERKNGEEKQNQKTSAMVFVVCVWLWLWGVDEGCMYEVFDTVIDGR
jgi:hypothetical protein